LIERNEFFYRNGGLRAHGAISLCWSSKINAVLFKAGVSIKLRKPFIKPHGYPMQIHVQDGVGVFVVDNLLSVPGPAVHSDQRKLLLPTVKKHAGIVPFKLRQELLESFIITSDIDDQRGTRFEPGVREPGREDVAHPLHLTGRAAGISLATTRENTKMRAAHFNPGFILRLYASCLQEYLDSTADNQTKSH